jgi:hypothetical protein
MLNKISFVATMQNIFELKICVEKSFWNKLSSIINVPLTSYFTFVWNSSLGLILDVNERLKVKLNGEKWEIPKIRFRALISQKSQKKIKKIFSTFIRQGKVRSS